MSGAMALDVHQRCTALWDILQRADNAERASDLDMAKVLTWQVLERTLGKGNRQGEVPDEIKMVAAEAIMRAERLKGLVAKETAANASKPAHHEPPPPEYSQAGPRVNDDFEQDDLANQLPAKVLSNSVVRSPMLSPQRRTSREVERQKLRVIENECTKLRDELDQRRAQSEIQRKQSQTEMKLLSEQLKKAQKDQGELQNQLSELEQEKQDMLVEREKRIEELTESIASLTVSEQESKQEADARLKDLDKQLRDREASIALVQQFLDDSTTAMNQAENEKEELHKEIEELNAEHNAAQETIDKLQAELNEAKNATKQQEKECIYCFDNEADHAFVPCGHMCLCQECAEVASLKISEEGDLQCYLCKAQSASVIRIFQT